MLHTTLADGRWNELSFAEQMAHVGSEVERSIQWRFKGREEIAQAAFERSAELLSLTIESARSEASRLKELTRLRECWFDYFAFDNQYRSTAESWQQYFRQFALLTQKLK